MSDNKNELIEQLCQIGLDHDEATIYLALLPAPSTHLQLSRITGINRTKVYRLVAELEKRSIVTRQSDDRGTFLIVNDPLNLEIELMTKEEKIKQQLHTLQKIVPTLKQLQKKNTNMFVVNTYEGIEGFKQMQWNELNTKGELLVFGNVTVEDLIDDRRWSENFRARTIALGYTLRELINMPYVNQTFSENEPFMQKVYRCRSIATNRLPITTPIIIYNDTVAIYQYRHTRRVGLEVVNKSFAQTMRYIFEHYWQLADKKEV